MEGDRRPLRSDRGGRARLPAARQAARHRREHRARGSGSAAALPDPFAQLAGRRGRRAGRRARDRRGRLGELRAVVPARRDRPAIRRPRALARVLRAGPRSDRQAVREGPDRPPDRLAGGAIRRGRARPPADRERGRRPVADRLAGRRQPPARRSLPRRRRHRVRGATSPGGRRPRGSSGPPGDARDPLRWSSRTG